MALQNAFGALALDASLQAVTATGSLSAVAAAVTMATGGRGILGVEVSGTWNATLVVEGTLDGTNWVPLKGVDQNGNLVTSITGGSTAPTRYQSAGYSQVRTRVSAYTSGPAVVTMYATQSGLPLLLEGPLPAGANQIGNIGTLNALLPGIGQNNLGKGVGSTGGSADVGVGLLALRAPVTPVARSAAGAYSPGLVDTEGRFITKPYADLGNTWASSLQLTTTTATVLRGAPAAGLRNYLVDLLVSNSAATATLLTLLDGATVVARIQLPATIGAPGDHSFRVPLNCSPATALNVQLSVASTVNVSGFGYIGV